MGSGGIGVFALSFALALLARPAAGDETAVDLELVLAVDVSFSMDEREQRVQRNGSVDALQSPQVISAIRSGPLGRIAVTYVEWGGSAVETVPWTVIDSPASAARFAEALSRQPRRRLPFTSLSETIAFVRHLIAANAFQARRRVSNHRAAAESIRRHHPPQAGDRNHRAAAQQAAPPRASPCGL